MSKNIYAKIFARRVVLSFFVVLLLFLCCILRIAVIATGDYEQVSIEQSRYRINIAKLRGTIYDCNMVPLTNNKIQKVAAVSPTPQAITYVSQNFVGDELKNTLDILKNNKPAICNVEKEFSTAGISTTKIYTRDTSNNTACHLIGYTDNTGHGISGLEYAYDDFLYSDAMASAVFTIDGKHNILKGIDPYFENDLSIVHSGVVTTIDINIQKIVEKAITALSSGCAIVAEVKSSKIRGMASVPTFDIANLVSSLKEENSPLLNRALCTFNVGSIFKPSVAAVALENKFNFVFNCEGSTQIGDRIFRCHNLSGHGEMNLANSLAQSCNCYFYNLALEIGSTPIYKMANSLTLGSKIKIADNMYATAGNISDINALSNDGALANFSIGQGSLMASPVAMLNLYLAIANDGSYHIPSVVEKTIKDGVENIYDIGYPTRVMQNETAALLREHLQRVITDGTGNDALPNTTTAAGKTATAQTGRRDEDGVEITNSWFCGFFPYDSPQYVVVVMCDGKLKTSTASIFAKIADEITILMGKNVDINS